MCWRRHKVWTWSARRHGWPRAQPHYFTQKKTGLGHSRITLHRRKRASGTAALLYTEENGPRAQPHYFTQKKTFVSSSNSSHLQYTFPDVVRRFFPFLLGLNGIVEFGHCGGYIFACLLIVTTHVGAVVILGPVLLELSVSRVRTQLLAKRRHHHDSLSGVLHRVPGLLVNLLTLGGALLLEDYIRVVEMQNRIRY